MCPSYSYGQIPPLNPLKELMDSRPVAPRWRVSIDNQKRFLLNLGYIENPSSKVERIIPIISGGYSPHVILVYRRCVVHVLMYIECTALDLPRHGLWKVQCESRSIKDLQWRQPEVFRDEIWISPKSTEKYPDEGVNSILIPKMDGDNSLSGKLRWGKIP